MHFRRRRNEEQPVVLPSLDRLSGLVERVVELVEQVGEAKPAPAPPPRPAVEPSGKTGAVAPVASWVAFVSAPHGYTLVERPGPLPARGRRIELEGGAYVVLKLGASPLPGDRRRCAYLVGEEPAEATRTSDG